MGLKIDQSLHNATILQFMDEDVYVDRPGTEGRAVPPIMCFVPPKKTSLPPPPPPP